ncbi:MAG: S1C family serine protease [Acidimicrobiales bacterium]
MRRWATIYRVAGMAGVLLATAACGGGSDSSSPTTTIAKKLTSKEVFEIARPSTVELHAKQGADDVGGSGVIIDAQKGLVLTNAHVVAGTAALKVKVNDAEETPARVLASAPCQDLAVVQMVTVPPGLKAMTFGSSASVQNQDEVVALGYPATFADPAKEKVVSTSGTVQSPNVAAEPDPSLPRYPSTIQHSAVINPGNSGGPLLNDKGELIGINTLANTGSGPQTVQGQYYAISIDHIKPLLADLVAGRSQPDPGWSVAPFSEVPLADVFELTGYGTRDEGVLADQVLAENGVNGMFVFGANPNSPTDKVSIEGGDLVETIDGVPVTAVKDVCDILASTAPGQTLAVEGRYLTNSGDEH